MRYPIRYQFIAPLLAVALVGLCSAAVISAWLVTVHTRTKIERQLQSVAAVLGGSSFPLNDTVLMQMANLAGMQFLLTDDHGTPVAASGPDAAAAIGLPTVHSATKLEDVRLGMTIQHGSKRFFHASLGIGAPFHGSATSTLHMLISQEDYNRSWRSAFYPPLAAGLFTACGLVAVASFVAGRLRRFMKQLGAEVHRLSEGNFAPVATPHTNDESLDLAVAVNRTASRLSEYEAEVRRTERLRTLATLGAGLAHEIRNAATGCRMAIDLHAAECPACKLENDDLSVAQRQLTLIETRLRQFLRVGKEPEPTTPTRVDLANIVQEAMRLVAAASDHAGVTVTFFRPEFNCETTTHEDLVRQSVINLLLNAVEASAKRCARGGVPARVCVALTKRDDSFELDIADSGEGPRTDLAERLFEPFVSEKPEGVGLGLAVTREAVEACHGEVRWGRYQDETHFTLRLPIEIKERANA